MWTETGLTRSLEGVAALKGSPVLVYPDFSKPFFVKTDGSKTHMAGILTQIQEGKESVIELLSKITYQEKSGRDALKGASLAPSE